MQGCAVIQFYYIFTKFSFALTKPLLNFETNLQTNLLRGKTNIDTVYSSNFYVYNGKCVIRCRYCARINKALNPIAQKIKPYRSATSKWEKINVPVSSHCLTKQWRKHNSKLFAWFQNREKYNEIVVLF